MRATLLYGPRDVRLDQVPDPRLRLPTDALVRVVAACVCGSDLWPYRGVRATRQPRRIGHEFVGVVEEVVPRSARWAYLPELLAEVLAGTLDPGPVFDLQLPLDTVAEAYAAIDERRTIKPLLRP